MLRVPNLVVFVVAINHQNDWKTTSILLWIAKTYYQKTEKKSLKGRHIYPKYVNNKKKLFYIGASHSYSHDEKKYLKWQINAELNIQI